jgi:hypothetical protein
VKYQGDLSKGINCLNLVPLFPEVIFGKIFFNQTIEEDKEVTGPHFPYL